MLAIGGIVFGLLVHFKTFQFTFQFNFQSAAPESLSATTLGSPRTLSIASAASTMNTTAPSTGIVILILLEFTQLGENLAVRFIWFLF